jgi:2-C-methyl-D-erythritol 4-phosphate cytidylyltransferase
LRLKVAAIVPSAGQGRRLNTKTPKAFIRISGKPLFIHTLHRLKSLFPFEEMIVPVPAAQFREARLLLNRHGLRNVEVIGGGRTRSQSVLNALTAVSPECEWVLVHDAARPFVSRAVLQRLFKALPKHRAVICAVPLRDSVKRIDPKKGLVLVHEDRAILWAAQTPQAFKKDLLKARYRILGDKAFAATDEAALFEGSSVRVKAVEGDNRNIKVTTKDDLQFLRKAHADRHRL